jgi:hypothetical protein
MKTNCFVSLFFWGMIAMAINFSGCAFPKFEKYSSRDPELNVEMDYFSGWVFSESRGAYDSYAQAIFLEPVKKGKLLRASMVLTMMKESKVNFKPLTLEGFLEDWMKKWGTRNNVKIFSQEKSRICDLDAYVVKLTYEELANPESAKANFIPMQERVVLFKRNGQYYMLRYVNVFKDFRFFDGPFSHCTRSLKFK